MRILASWKRLAPALLIALSLASALQAQAATLSKEYIRLGGRILAIEQAALPGNSVPPVYQNWAYLNQAPDSGWPGQGTWFVVGAGDFNRDGVPDLVYMNTVTRQVVVNYYGGANGAVYQGSAYLDAAGEPGWTVTGVADMNGDGVPDLIWQNDTTTQVVVHYYGGAGGAVYQGWAYLDATGAPGWTIVGVADFDGNGTPDLDATERPGWTVRGAADMNGDGVPDLIWENNSTGQVVVHFYGGAGGAVFENWEWLRNGYSAPGWRVAALADFDGNGEPDLVWQDNSSPYEVTVNYYDPG